MSTQAFFIVYDTTTGAIKRHGKCPREHLAAQARAGKNEAVAEDQPRAPAEAIELMRAQKMVMPAKGAAYLRRRPAAEIEARRPKQLAAPVGIDHLLAVLNDKLGVKITRQDLESARDRKP